MLSEEGATEVWLSLLLTSLSLPLAIKNLKRGKTSSYERHPQYLRMVGFHEKNLFQLSLFLEFFSKRRKCLPEVEFFPWVFCLSFVLEFQFFRRPVWKKRACDTTRFYVFTYLLHRRNRFLGFITELEHQTPPALLMRAERVAWTHYEICDQEEVWNNYRPIYLYVLRGTWIHDLVQHIMAKWVPLYILKLLGNRQFSSKNTGISRKWVPLYILKLLADTYSFLAKNTGISRMIFLIPAGCLNASKKIKRHERRQHKMATLGLLNGMPFAPSARII